MTELSNRFDFKQVDSKWAKTWEEKNLFHAEVDFNKKPYTIVIPPPNVTGILHMGHALNNTLQDIIIRYKRMNGFETLWMPGTDHAGIATQNVVEKALAKEGKKRQDLGREAFVERLWSWKKEYGDTIIDQLKKLGASCDWERTRFTMDDDYSNAVKHTFVSLYDKGLIYQGHRIINWCPRCQTALSDEEAEHKETQGNLYHIKYPFKDNPNEFVTVATTRPETMLGDSAVAVNPKDKRYKKVIGKTLVLPLVDREIRIISDDFVDPKFGTGAVKVTPAHDPNDFAMGNRHKLEFINVMHPDGRINELGGTFNDLDRFKARKAIIESLQQQNLLVKIDPHTHAVGHCYRCDTIVEPYLSKQWFVKMAPLAKPAADAVRKGKIKFYPKRWTKVYLNWMDNIQDWCISRQIWWGHRIPVWYCENNCAPIVTESAPHECPKCHSKNLKQDEDVLDTWFSSWLWPFATLNWPKESTDLKFFYPGASLFTASEIIFFWVARMIMAGLEFMDDIPFKDVYIHGTVRDEKGRKMSKSLGNAIDPLEIINEYGADALRFSLIINSGQDLFISKEKFEIGRNFANKIWNASRLILMNTGAPKEIPDLSKIAKDKNLDLPTKWIISRFYSTLLKVNNAIESYKYSDAENLIQDFFWGNFCDWYLEIIKNGWSKKIYQDTALGILINSLKMIHPFMPFVTEELWAHLNLRETALCVQPWPKLDKKGISAKNEHAMQTLIEIITAIRNLRAQWNVNPKLEMDCLFTIPDKDNSNFIHNNETLIKSLSKLATITIENKTTDQKNCASGIAGGIKFTLPLGNIIDIEKEKERLNTLISENEKQAIQLSQRLNNQDFLKKAPAEIVKKEKERLNSLETRSQELSTLVKSLE